MVCSLVHRVFRNVKLPVILVDLLFLMYNCVCARRHVRVVESACVCEHKCSKGQMTTDGWDVVTVSRLSVFIKNHGFGFGGH